MQNSYHHNFRRKVSIGFERKDNKKTAKWDMF